MDNEGLQQRFPVICLMGPTASGKSNLAVELALKLNCEIVSVDSVLVYRGMDIGTAKPTLVERQGIPHHLIDILDQAEVFSTGQFRTRAIELIRSIHNRGKTPLLVGGTMLYFRSLLDGLATLPEANSKIRDEIDREALRVGWKTMHSQLASVDPIAAARIHYNDPQRIQRALEVFRVTGKSITELCNEQSLEKLPFFTIRLKIVPSERERLHARIETRFREMIRTGLIEEVEQMHQRGDLNPDFPSVRAVGYRQVWAYLVGEMDKETMIDKGIIATRQLAKRQLTWLRKESTSLFYNMENSNLSSQILFDVEPLLHSDDQTKYVI